MTDPLDATVGAAEASPRPLERWGPLEIRRELGRGAFGVVYRAWDPQLVRDVALKIVSDEVGVERAEAADILGEARRLARVRHPNVVVVYGADQFNGSIGLWMELIEGRTLKQLVREQGPRGAAEAIHIGVEVCGAVSAVHNAGLVHRDIKADNIMREQGGRLVLMDFGCGARRTDLDLALTRVGMPAYWAPEILEGASASVRTDVYCIGVLLFYLLTGRYPISGNTLADIRASHRQGLRVRLHDARPDVPASISAVIDRALDPDPAMRHATAGELRAALVAAGSVQPVGAVDASAVTTAEPIASRPSSSRRLLAIATALGLLSAVSAGYWWFERAKDASAQSRSLAVESVAVFPFQDLTGDANRAFMANAVSIELAASLERRGGIKTLPWNAVRQMVDKGQDVAHVVRRIGADAAVEGSVQLVPGPTDAGKQTVRINASLRQTSTGAVIWTDRVEDDLGHFLAMANGIADRMANHMGVTLALREGGRVNRRPTADVDSETMELYLRGRALLSRNDSRAAQLEALGYFNQAIARNDRFVEAYGALAKCYALLSVYWNAIDARSALDRIMTTTDKALKYDQNDADVWAMRGYAHYLFAWDWARADDDFNRALKLGPVPEGIRRDYLQYLTSTSRFKEAIEQGEAESAAFPALADSHRAAAWAYYMSRDYDGASLKSLEALRVDPEFIPARTLLARVYSARGMHADAIAEIRAVTDRPGGKRYRPILAFVLAAAGERDTALKELEAYLAEGSDDDYDVGVAYAALGMPDKAMAVLERCFATRNASIVLVKVDPRLDPLRTRSDFQQLINRLHFPGHPQQGAAAWPNETSRTSPRTEP